MIDWLCPSLLSYSNRCNCYRCHQYPGYQYHSRFHCLRYDHFCCYCYHGYLYRCIINAPSALRKRVKFVDTVQDSETSKSASESHVKRFNEDTTIHTIHNHDTNHILPPLKLCHKLFVVRFNAHLTLVISVKDNSDCSTPHWTRSDGHSLHTAERSGLLLGSTKNLC